MELHANARLSVEGRRLLCRRVRELNWKVADAAFAGGISERRAYEWLARFDAGENLTDRPSRPKSSPNRTPARVEAVIVQLRRLRKTASTIAALLRMAVSTVCAVLARVGLNRLSKLDPPEPANRYCRRHAGELIHLDIKTLGRFRRPGKRALGQGADRRSAGAGWEAVHVAVDDATRLAYVEVLADQTAATTVGFLRRAIAWFAARGVTVQEVMTDNGSAYVSRLWAATCAEVGLVHIRTRPYRPRTNGKAERFIQTLLREWAYAATYRDSEHRRAVLPEWVRYYNTQRPHGSLGHRSPITALAAA
ncbi:IS481 family transposase [Microcella alkalica]|uniref:Transposase InsO family protein n=1 Tax=Microcella alkalica TaxID=355930 RepID=A0A839E782_9MICO|nr:IS481 family transposase [Microcella alkalica]MBA8847377.1 transposase InsO family protein [Microcella alkalica]